MNIKDFFRLKPIKTLLNVWREETYGTNGPSGFDTFKFEGANEFAKWLDSLYLQESKKV